MQTILRSRLFLHFRSIRKRIDTSLLIFLAGDVRGGPVPHRGVSAAVYPRVEGGTPPLPEGRHGL